MFALSVCALSGGEAVQHLAKKKILTSGADLLSNDNFQSNIPVLHSGPKCAQNGTGVVETGDREWAQSRRVIN